MTTTPVVQNGREIPSTRCACQQRLKSAAADVPSDACVLAAGRGQRGHGPIVSRDDNSLTGFGFRDRSRQVGLNLMDWEPFHDLILTDLSHTSPNLFLERRWPVNSNRDPALEDVRRDCVEEETLAGGEPVFSLSRARRVSSSAGS